MATQRKLVIPTAAIRNSVRSHRFPPLARPITHQQKRVPSTSSGECPGQLRTLEGLAQAESET
eukprot:CAMPEP_0202820366 /NCGR_PEP_ID=MMETSP1389-20130828/9689_1 /ASSEMBLY_ACC=CAM_ASM_000865 /TAXON_ID=302021 /ORGANISM="Rhodomonas sp., Strain CCMP768" /LENGTH=62 /DNA_ID=CAMNT_0049493033 /DNA_START=123 /DNA_END=308 /DNA_ORIENTATION=+